MSLLFVCSDISFNPIRTCKPLKMEENFLLSLLLRMFLEDLQNLSTIMLSSWTPQQLAKVHCYYPEDHPHLMKSPVTTAEKHVIIQGCILELQHNQCVVCVHNITLEPSTGVVKKCCHTEAVLPAKLKSFNWSGSKQKR